MKKAYRSLVFALFSAFIILLMKLNNRIADTETGIIIVFEVLIFSSIIGFIIGIQNLEEKPQFLNWIGLILNLVIIVYIAECFFWAFQMGQN